MSRRSMLVLTGAATVATSSGLAGCLEVLGMGDDHPTYAPWLAAGDGVGFVYVDWGSLQAISDRDSASLEEHADDGEDEESLRPPRDDPLGRLPFDGFFLIALVVSAGLERTGLDALLGIEGATADDRSPSTTIDEVLLTDGTLVMTGDVDVEEVHEYLTGEGTERRWRRTYEHVDRIEEFEVYQLPEDTFSIANPTIALRDDAIVYSLWDPNMDTIRSPIEAHAGVRDRAVDTWEDFAWLLETAGKGHVVLGHYRGGRLFSDEVSEDEPIGEDAGPDDRIANAEGLVASVTFEADATRTAFAGIFDAVDEDTEAELEEALESTADERSIAVHPDTNRVHITGIWYQDDETADLA